ncbi:MAG: helix-hairpin-helix domain-containing protein [Gammaproteobacteria bacterium]|nr:helix-hairpin-helix domain-containing protein [Gammaproteobacteria bacterium]
MEWFTRMLSTALLLVSTHLSAAPVDINTADAAALAEALNGVGEAKARAIVAHRDQYGAFKSAEDLALVKGIGPRIVELNREVILVSSSPTATGGSE